ncbi:ankyrin repeat and SOCS box protein 3-like, partial [Trichogramma pretiosum]|uniref:ankyrin repeat and SOCS box protein 3-like n=1 Tax=Trichogramma pretiosum TaxID=7493 RepID=UPI000C718CD2
AAHSFAVSVHSICNKSYDDDAFDTLKRLFDISDEEQKPILVDAQDKWGWTPLHIAVHRKQARLIRLLLNRGANPNTANAKGETPLHKICELCEIETIAVVNMCMIPFREVKERVQADIRDNKGNAPLHIALDEGYKNLIEWLLRIGADPNCANKNGETALHIIIDRHTGSLYDKELVEEFFKIVDDERLTLQIDVKNNSGRTPLQCAAANLLPEVVGVLLDRGADLANFVFPTLCGEFGKDPEWKLTAPCRAVGVVEQLKGRGYELDRSHAMMIMKFLCRLRLFVRSVAGQKGWYDDSKAKNIMVKSDLSLHDLAHLRPEEVAKLLNYKDCLDLVTSEQFRKLPHRSRKAYTVYLGEITARRFFLRWALDPFMELIHYRLPHLCCDMIIENLENKDLYNICLARS